MRSGVRGAEDFSVFCVRESGVGCRMKTEFIEVAFFGDRCQRRMFGASFIDYPNERRFFLVLVVIIGWDEFLTVWAMPVRVEYVCISRGARVCFARRCGAGRWLLSRRFEAALGELLTRMS